MNIYVPMLMNKTEAFDRRAASESMGYNGFIVCLWPLSFSK